MRMMCGTCLRESGASTIRGSGPAVLGRSAGLDRAAAIGQCEARSLALPSVTRTVYVS